MLLTKSIYGCETSPKKTPFGFLNNQIRTNSILNNAGWFNGLGQKLGFGDLSMEDMQKISMHLPKTECFIVLSEFDTSWTLPSNLDSSTPGVDYVMQNCAYVISPGNIYRIRDGAIEEVIKDNVKYKRIPRQELFKLFNYNVKKIAVPQIKKTISDENEITDDFKKKVQKLLTASKSALLPAQHILIKNNPSNGTSMTPGKITAVKKPKLKTP